MPRMMRKLTTTAVRANADCLEGVWGLKRTGFVADEPDGPRR